MEHISFPARQRQPLKYVEDSRRPNIVHCIMSRRGREPVITSDHPVYTAVQRVKVLNLCQSCTQELPHCSNTLGTFYVLGSCELPCSIVRMTRSLRLKIEEGYFRSI
jgi:hypothetical protein